MKLSIVVAAVLCAPLFVSAQTTPAPTTPAIPKTCDDVKAEIAKKLDAKGVINYTLTIVDKGKETEGKIIGNCGGGTKSIVYQRGTLAPQPADDKKQQ